MNERWASQFLGMLNEMEKFGSVGHSGVVAIYADGDGDFRPKFFFSTPGTNTPMPEMAKGEEITGFYDAFFDAG